jgi:hypothetical protein
LLSASDNALVMLNGGDELALSFDASKLPPKSPGFVRNFFLYVVGWDKDADFHVAEGWRVEPLPSVHMDSQRYADRVTENAGWATKYNTRWIGPMVMEKSGR